MVHFFSKPKFFRHKKFLLKKKFVNKVIMLLLLLFALMRFNSFQSSGPDPVDRLAAKNFKEMAKKMTFGFVG